MMLLNDVNMMLFYFQIKFQGLIMSDQDNKEFIERFTVRMPTGMREKIAKIADENGRSMNSEIVQVLQDHIDSANVKPPVKTIDIPSDFIDKLEAIALSIEELKKR